MRVFIAKYWFKDSDEGNSNTILRYTLEIEYHTAHAIIQACLCQMEH